MEVIKDVLAELGVDSIDEMKINECYRVEKPHFEDLVIELVGDDRLSVAQVYTQRGDLMRDPEIVFDISGAEWMPVMYQLDPLEYKQDDSGLPDVAKFSCDWGNTLRKQGFVEAAKEA